MKQILFLIVLLAACSTSMVECWDGTMAQEESLCPMVPMPEPAGCTEDAKVCPDGSVLAREGPDCKFPECPVVEPTLTAHAEYAQPEAREERREERKEEIAERLEIVEMAEVKNGMTINAMNGEDVFMFDEMCETCTLKANVRFSTEGSKPEFGILMKYRDGAKSPRFMFEGWSGNLSIYNALYGEDYLVRKTSLPTEFLLSVNIARDSIEVFADDKRVLKEDSVGPMATGKGFGRVVKDAKVLLSDVVYKNWQ